MKFKARGKDIDWLVLYMNHQKKSDPKAPSFPALFFFTEIKAVDLMVCLSSQLFCQKFVSSALIFPAAVIVKEIMFLWAGLNKKT